MREFRPDRALLLNVVIYVEAALLLIATIWCWLGNIPLAPVLVPHGKDFAIGAAVGIALVITSAVLYGASHLLEKVLKKKSGPILSIKQIAVEELAPLFAQLNAVDIFLIAVVSGFCEEVFFRGALQLDFNLWIAAGIFGMFHMPTFRYLTYGVWAMAAGVVFGLTMETTHSLWAPITGHAINNLLVILFFRYGPIDKIASGNSAEEVDGTSEKKDQETKAGEEKNSPDDKPIIGR
ncbi:MAG: hypothetical protein C0469_05395 [Cyanobacteria bacterium DS2.3.42]|nr:hypothetical protein [Cyanobacteria bacterium DS2.3.42]